MTGKNSDSGSTPPSRRTSRKIPKLDPVSGQQMLGPSGQKLWESDELAEAMGKRLSEARKTAGFSADEVGKLVGVSRQTIHSYEEGNSAPSIPVLNKLARLYKRSIQWVVTGETPTSLEAALEMLSDEQRRRFHCLDKYPALAALVDMWPQAPLDRVEELNRLVGLLFNVPPADWPIVAPFLERLQTSRSR